MINPINTEENKILQPYWANEVLQTIITIIIIIIIDWTF